MDDAEQSTQEPEAQNQERRCPVCDSVIQTAGGRCLMCGAEIEAATEAGINGLVKAQTVIEPSLEEEVEETVVEGDATTGLKSIVEAVSVPEVKEEAQTSRSDVPQPISDRTFKRQLDGQANNAFESTLEEKQSPFITILAIGFFAFVCSLAILVLRNPSAASLAFFPTPTTIPATLTYTPTWTPFPTDTIAPSDTPTITPTPPPTETPRPPRSHTVSAGETLFGLSLRYGVTMDSIAEINQLPAGSGIQVSQQLLIPWPTATPPLEPVAIEIGGEKVVADPTDCRMYEIKGGDTFFGISARERIDLPALMAVNRLTEQSVLQPGDLICIPNIIRGGVLPPTPGPSPTPTSTEPPPGPHLLYPIDHAAVEPPEGPLFLQWAAVKDLEESEWYMIEVTDLSAVDSHPFRGFTRQTSFNVPESWRPAVPENHIFRWRVRIVLLTGEREDGSFIYTFGGQNSDEATFEWFGSTPTPIPTPTPTQLPTPFQ